MRARIVFLIRVPAERREDFLAAYERIRYQVSGGVPGHLRDQVCQSVTDPEQWLITSEWRRVADFLAWEATEEHRELVRPMRECVTEARSLRFLIRAETEAGAPVGDEAPSRGEALLRDGAPSRGEALLRGEAPFREGAFSKEEAFSSGEAHLRGEASSREEAGISPEAEVGPAAAAVARGSA
ncbi:antibiotic biosynthesis monooxygenase family protein [Streptosporangium sp. NPDC002524]|uniref:antibiotic biosynthesis monooxygenase family protein n=1 Tax=Streptosporangium sp. NPDC002524 TaxID=3154537 RepID=UPI00331B21E4